MNSDNIKKEIKLFLEKETQSEIRDSSLNLVEAGILDSFNMVKLIVFIEKEFKIVMDFDDVDMGSFNSIDNIFKRVLKWK